MRKITRLRLLSGRGGWGRWSQAVGVKDQGLYFAVGTLGGQRFSVEFKVECTRVAGFDHDLIGGMDSFLSGRAKTAALQDLVSIRSDRQPGIGVQGDAESQRFGNGWQGRVLAG